MRWITFILFFLFAFPSFLKAQDVHFSQFYAAPYNLNPALTGAFNGDYRITGNYRSQWRSITVPYVTTGLFFDARNLGKENLHGGVSIYHDKAGDSRFSTFQFNLSGAYSKKIDAAGKQQLTAGIQTGFSQRSINYGSLSFDNQFDGNKYDPGLGSGEAFARPTYMFLNLNAGLAYGIIVNDKLNVATGIALYNLNKPEQSFFSNERIGLDRRFTYFAKGKILLDEKVDLLPSFLWMKQGPHSEYLLGSAVGLTLEDIPGRYRALYLGTWFRLRDAGFIMAGMEYNSWNVGISYDLNFSNLVPASNYRGGFEVSVIYIIKKPVPQRIRYKVCPGFI